MLRAAARRGDLAEAIDGPYREWLKARLRTVHTAQDCLRLADDIERVAPPGWFTTIIDGLRADARREKRRRRLIRGGVFLTLGFAAFPFAWAPTAISAALFVLCTVALGSPLALIDRIDRHREEQAALHRPALAAARLQVQTFADRCTVRPALIAVGPMSRRTSARPRERRYSARRASGTRSGTDPGGADADSEPPRHGGQPRHISGVIATFLRSLEATR